MKKPIEDPTEKINEYMYYKFYEHCKDVINKFLKSYTHEPIHIQMKIVNKHIFELSEEIVKTGDTYEVVWRRNIESEYISYIFSPRRYNAWQNIHSYIAINNRDE